MRFKRHLSALLAIMTALSCILFTSLPAHAADSAPFSKSAKFSSSFYIDGSAIAVHSGLVRTGTATLTDNVTGPSNTISTLITPRSGSYPVGLKHSNAPKLGIDLAGLDYIRYRYYYDGDAFTGKRAKIVIKQSDFNLSAECTVYSLETVVSGEWAYLTFAVKDEIWGYTYQNGLLPEFEFYPFADSPSSDVASEKLYLDELFFWSDDCANAIAAKSAGTLVHKYPVYFEPGRPDTTGTRPETIYAELGETIVLPENTYMKEGYVFDGWICSEGSIRMQPGDEYTLSEKTIKGGVDYNTARTFFVADWKSLSDTAANLPSINNVRFSEYSCGITDYRNYASYKKNTTFGSIDTVEFSFYPSNSDSSLYAINLDGWNWDSLPLDYSKYKYLMVLYYFETEGTTTAFRPYINFLGSAASETNSLSRAIKINAKKNISYNKWDIMCFEFDILKSYPTYVKSEDNTVLRQMHFFPIGSNKANRLTEGDKLYVANFIFLDEIPSTVPEFKNGYLSGYEDGTFRPHGILTNAEAASLVTKAQGLREDALEKYTETSYSDITNDAWYLGSVSYLESCGALRPSPGEKFNPEGAADRAEFTKLLVDLKSGNTNAPSDDIASFERGVLTRAEAVSYINSILYDTVYSSVDAAALKESPFADISERQWFYPDVALAASSIITYKKKDGTAAATGVEAKKDPDTRLDITDEQYAAGLAYVSELDVLTEQRIYEIRNTESEYKAGPGGKIYYLSSTDGNPQNEGISQENPKRISSLNEVTLLTLNPGDVVLFKRGDTFRGYMTAKAGVTYSAYGDGEKPLFTRSPENGSGKDKWTLIHEDNETGAKIWKYYDDTYVDVGGIALINSAGEHFMAYKNIPDYQTGAENVTQDADYIPGEENFWTRGGMGTERFRVLNELDHDFEYVHLAQYTLGDDGKTDYNKRNLTSGVPDGNAIGPLYLRCDAGNPGVLYPRIEFNLRTTVLSAAGNGVTVDNICFKYFGSHGIGSGRNNLTVRNCEIGWGGGAIQTYNAGKDSAGRATRFGNGVEIYGGLVNYVIDNCYVYQIYDAGITHQISSSSHGNYYMEGVYYTNNVLTHSTYNIEYFMSKTDQKTADGKLVPSERFMKDVYFTDNIVRYAGYGWGVQRPDNGPSNVKGWTHHNFVTNYVIEGNIFDRCIDLQNNNTDYSLQLGTTFRSSTPYLKDNIFVQVPDRQIMLYGNVYYNCDTNGENILNTVGGTGNKLYYYPDDFDDYADVIYWLD